MLKAFMAYGVFMVSLLGLANSQGHVLFNLFGGPSASSGHSSGGSYYGGRHK